MLIGDSHAAAITRALDQVLRRDRASARAFVSVGCIYAPSLRRNSEQLERALDCQGQNQRWLSLLKTTPIDTVILMARYTAHLTAKQFDNEQGGLEPMEMGLDPLHLPGYRLAAE